MTWRKLRRRQSLAKASWHTVDMKSVSSVGSAALNAAACTAHELGTCTSKQHRAGKARQGKASEDMPLADPYGLAWHCTAAHGLAHRGEGSISAEGNGFDRSLSGSARSQQQGSALHGDSKDGSCGIVLTFGARTCTMHGALQGSVSRHTAAA